MSTHARQVVLRVAIAAMIPTAPLSALAADTVAPALRSDCPSYVRHDPGGDYNDPTDKQGLEVVEHFHFTPAVESLAHGATGPLGGDISYTLEHFPNHPRALAALAKLGRRDKSAQPYGARYSIVCFFERAIRFVPNDARVRSVYGAYLLGGGDQAGAMAQLLEAARLEPQDPTTNYNLGLMYMKKREYAKALPYAQKAYAKKFPLQGLKRQLIEAGQWREPAVEEAPAPPAQEPSPDEKVPSVPEQRQ